ncbi:MAG: hypothetical protein ACK55I_44335, partial [bacterium]
MAGAAAGRALIPGGPSQPSPSPPVVSVPPSPHRPAAPRARTAAVCVGALVAASSLATPVVAQTAPISPARRAVYDAYLDFD